MYGVGLVLTIACTIMTIASIALPRWASYSPTHTRKFSYGLHSRCSALSGECVPFPRSSDCAKDPSFCNAWRTVGFLTSFAVVVELCTLVSFIVIIGGGVQRRVAGWQVAVGVLSVGGVVEGGGMGIVAYLFTHDARFFHGWHLDLSFYLATLSWVLLLLTALGIATSALLLQPEGDYELIDPNDEYAPPDDRLLSRIAAWDNGWKGSNSSEEYSYQRNDDSDSIRSSVVGSVRRESDMSFKDRRDSSIGAGGGRRSVSVARSGR